MDAATLKGVPLRKKNKQKQISIRRGNPARNHKEVGMKKQSTASKIIKKIFLKETVIRADGKEIKGFTVFGWVLIIGAVVCGLCALEAVGVIDNLVMAFGRHGGR